NSELPTRPTYLQLLSIYLSIFFSPLSLIFFFFSFLLVHPPYTPCPTSRCVSLSHTHTHNPDTPYCADTTATCCSPPFQHPLLSFSLPLSLSLPLTRTLSLTHTLPLTHTHTHTHTHSI